MATNEREAALVEAKKAATAARRVEEVATALARATGRAQDAELARRARGMLALMDGTIEALLRADREADDA